MRQRTSYPKPFKAQVVRQCLQPDVSIASVALRHGINANLMRKWIPLYRDQQPAELPAFVPLKLQAERQANTEPFALIELPGEHSTVAVKWPISDPEGCARFVRELAR